MKEVLRDGDALYKKETFHEVGVALARSLEGWRKVQVIHEVPLMSKDLLNGRQLDKGAEIPRHTSSTASIRLEPKAVAAPGQAITEEATADTVRTCLATMMATCLSWAMSSDLWA